MISTHTQAILSWMPDGACAEPANIDLPWLEERDEVSADQRDAMAAACRACPVAARCQAYVHETAICGGFWAGMHREPLALIESLPLEREAGQPRRSA